MKRCRMELSLPRSQNEKLFLRALCCVFPLSTKFALLPLKNTVCMDDRLSQGWDIGYCCEMRAFWRSSESLAPSVPLPEVRTDGASGALACRSAFYLAFSSLHQSRADGEVGLG